MPELIKLPQPIYDQTHSTHGLKAGDILIVYQNPRSNRFVDKIVAGFQGLWNEQGGHYNAEHGALVVEVDGKLQMAHLLSTGFVLEDLSNKRSKHVYRIKNEDDRIAIASELNQIIAEKSHFFKEKIFWRYFTTVMTYIRRSFNSIGIKNSSLVNEPRVAESAGIETNSICTKFVADSVLEAISRVNTHENLSERYMNISSMTAPKTFQAYLERNLNYETFVIPQAGNHLCERVKIMIPVTHETSPLLEAIKQFEADHLHDNDNDYEKTRKLMQHIHSLLECFPKLKQELKAYLKSQGIHEEYIRPDNVIETPENIKQWLMDKHYDTKEIAMYTIYRQRGLSDAEAQFSVKPTLSKWFALSPIRVIIGSIILPGIGILIALLIAAIRIDQAKTNRKNFEDLPPQGSTVSIASLPRSQLSKDVLHQPLHHNIFSMQTNKTFSPRPEYSESPAHSV